MNIKITCPQCKQSFVISSQYEHKALSCCPNCELQLSEKFIDSLKQCLYYYEEAEKHSDVTLKNGSYYTSFVIEVPS